MNGRWTFIFTGVCNPSDRLCSPVLTLSQFDTVVTGQHPSFSGGLVQRPGRPERQARIRQPLRVKISTPPAISPAPGSRSRFNLDTFLTGNMDSSDRAYRSSGTTRAYLGLDGHLQDGRAVARSRKSCPAGLYLVATSRRHAIHWWATEWPPTPSACSTSRKRPPACRGTSSTPSSARSSTRSARPSSSTTAPGSATRAAPCATTGSGATASRT